MANIKNSPNAENNDKSNMIASDIITDMKTQLEQSTLSINDQIVIRELIEEIVSMFGEQIETRAELQHYLFAHSETPSIDISEAIEHYKKLTEQENESLFISWQNESDITTTYIENMADLGFRGEIDYVDFTDYLCFAIAILKQVIEGKVTELPAAVKKATELAYMANSVTQQYKRLTYYWKMYERARPTYVRYIALLAPVLEGKEPEINALLDKTGKRSIRQAVESCWDDIHSLIAEKVDELHQDRSRMFMSQDGTHIDLIDLWYGKGQSIVRTLMVNYYLI